MGVTKPSRGVKTFLHECIFLPTDHYLETVLHDVSTMSSLDYGCDLRLNET